MSCSICCDWWSRVFYLIILNLGENQQKDKINLKRVSTIHQSISSLSVSRSPNVQYLTSLSNMSIVHIEIRVHHLSNDPFQNMLWYWKSKIFHRSLYTIVFVKLKLSFVYFVTCLASFRNLAICWYYENMQHMKKLISRCFILNCFWYKIL